MKCKAGERGGEWSVNALHQFMWVNWAAHKLQIVWHKTAESGDYITF